MLFFGTLEPRKNVGGLLDAYEQLLGEPQRTSTLPPLVLAGQGHRRSRAPWLERIARPPLAGRVRHIGYVDPADRRDAVRRRAAARAAVVRRRLRHPGARSDDLGVPVVAANRGALPEVLGDAGAARRSRRPGRDRRGHRAAARRSRRSPRRASARASRARGSSGGPHGARVCDAYQQAIAHARRHRSRAADAHRHRRARAVRAAPPASAATLSGLLARVGRGRAARGATSSCSTRRSRSACRSTRAVSRRASIPAAAGHVVGAGHACRAPSRSDHLDVFFAPAYTAPLSADASRSSSPSTMSRSPRTPSGSGCAKALRRRWLTRQPRSGRARSSRSRSSRKREIDRAARRRRGAKIHVIPPGIDWRWHGVPSSSPAASPPAAQSAVRRLDLQPPARARSDPRVRADRPRAHADASLDIVGDNRSYPREDIAGDDRRARASSGQVRWHEYVSDERAARALRARAGVRVPVRIRRARADAARSAGRRRAAGAARHAGRARELRRRGALRAAERSAGR